MTMQEEGDAKATWAAFRAKVKAPTTAKLPGMTEATRARYEADGQRRVDGRSKRQTGRSVKMTMKVNPDFKAHLSTTANDNDVGMAEILEVLAGNAAWMKEAVRIAKQRKAERAKRAGADASA